MNILALNFRTSRNSVVQEEIMYKVTISTNSILFWKQRTNFIRLMDFTDELFKISAFNIGVSENQLTPYIETNSF